MSFDFSTIKKQTADFEQINQILRKAYKSVVSAKATMEIDPEVCFNLAYESMLKTTLALMLSNGYRPRVQLGHHRTLVSYAEHILGSHFFEITSTYGRMRQKRNKLIYDVGNVSKSEANQALGVAEKYFVIVEDKISQENPQQKLWKPKKA